MVMNFLQKDEKVGVQNIGVKARGLSLRDA